EEDEDDSEFKLNEKTPPNDFAYWQEKWAAHFGTQLPFTRHIHEGLLQWASYFGDEEIVLHAFSKAGRYGAKSYAYLDSILRNWWDEGLRTAEDVYDREIAERY
ncbi:MAG: DnaD domain protein, partial [Trichococcus sp.]|uniref:DnaD domain protein n=1 Tax=Trichococcus sp. TaxID=1985464 RepID=UPI003C37C27D